VNVTHRVGTPRPASKNKSEKNQSTGKKLDFQACRGSGTLISAYSLEKKTPPPGRMARQRLSRVSVTAIADIKTRPPSYENPPERFAKHSGKESRLEWMTQAGPEYPPRGRRRHLRASKSVRTMIEFLSFRKKEGKSARRGGRVFSGEGVRLMSGPRRRHRPSSVHRGRSRPTRTSTSSIPRKKSPGIREKSVVVKVATSKRLLGT